MSFTRRKLLWQRYQTLRLFEQKSSVGKWLPTDVDPAKTAFGVDEDSSMKSFFLEVVIGMESFEGGE